MEEIVDSARLIEEIRGEARRKALAAAAEADQALVALEAEAAQELARAVSLLEADSERLVERAGVSLDAALALKKDQLRLDYLDAALGGVIRRGLELIPAAEWLDLLAPRLEEAAERLGPGPLLLELGGLGSSLPAGALESWLAGRAPGLAVRCRVQCLADAERVVRLVRVDGRASYQGGAAELARWLSAVHRGSLVRALFPGLFGDGAP